MRTALLSLVVLAMTSVGASAQTTYVGPWQPRPTIGIGLGAFGAITNNATAKLIRSGTLEVPVSDTARIRIETGQSLLPIVPESARDSKNPTDVAHIRRLTISIAGLKRPGAPATGYIGAGVAFQRATFDYAPKSGIRAGMYIHGGGEVTLSDDLVLDAELAFHGFKDDPWYQRKLITGEAVIRLKVGL